MSNDYAQLYIDGMRKVGYNGTISIEHEDSLMSPTEGLSKAIALMDGVIIKEDAGAMWWA